MVVRPRALGPPHAPRAPGYRRGRAQGRTQKRRPGRRSDRTAFLHRTGGLPRETPYETPNSRAISIRWTSLVPSPISRILESRHIRATGYSFMKP